MKNSPRAFRGCGVLFMNKVKARYLTIASLFAALLLTLALAVFSVLPRRSAKAVTEVDYEPSAVFAAGVGGEVGASEGTPAYIEFSLSDEGTVQYRRDLALKWFEADSANTSAAVANPGKAVYFGMRFSFPAVNFEVLSIEFQSDEENISKDAQSVNTLIFSKNEDGSLTVRVKNAAQQELENDSTELASGTVAADAVTKDFTLTFAEASDADAAAGDYKIVLTAGDAQVLESKFTNIGGNYLEYRSSAATTPNTPISFKAELPEGAEAQTVLMKELNGQSFELEEGKVKDDTAPVLVLNEGVYGFTLGKRFGLAYEAIDVCDDSVSVSRYYYMAKQDENGEYLAPSDPEDSNSDEKSDYETLTTSTYFMPVTENEKECVSIYFDLNDGRSRENDERRAERVYLTWYVASDEAILTENDYDFILVDRNEEGPAYTGLTADEASGTNLTDDGSGDTYSAAVEKFKKDLTEAAENTSAGTGAYLYFPSLRELIYSDRADYRNLQFTICYYQETQGEGESAKTESGLDYNELRIEVDEEGTYRIRILATDASSNAMKYYDEDGELVDVTSSNVWDIKGIPEFTVEIAYTGASIEEPGSQDHGYRDSTYSVEDFEVIALSGYIKDYTLYYFDQARLAEGQKMPSYDDCVENAKAYADPENGTYKGALTKINEYNDEITEDDENWDDTDNAYHWDPDSELSFVPQKSGIYFVQLVVTDPNRPGTTATEYMAIEVRNPVDTIPGQSQWLKNNVTSVVLFSISAVLAIVIVVLFVVKPSDKKVKEVDIEKLKGRPKNVNKKDDH